MNRRAIFFSALALIAGATIGRGTMLHEHNDRTVTETSDRLLIADLTARFADAANRHDWESMASLFDEHASWETSAGALGFRHEGRAAIRQWLLENPNGVDVLFYAALPPVIDLTSPDRARTRMNIIEILHVRATGETKRLLGTYSDDIIKRDGRWLFEHRRFVLQASFDEARASSH